MHVIMVKKWLQDGRPCDKCVHAEEWLRSRDLWKRIDEVLWAVEGDPESPGMQLASRYSIDSAPFFLVQQRDGSTRVFTSTVEFAQDGLYTEDGEGQEESSNRSSEPAPRLDAALSEEHSASAPEVKPIATLVGIQPKSPSPDPSKVSGPPPGAGATGPESGRISSPVFGNSEEDMSELARTFESLEPMDILCWGLERYGENCAIAFSGAEDVVLLDMAVKSGLKFRVLTLDTGRLHPETYRFIEQVRKHYHREIEVVFPSAERVENLVRRKGLFSFYEDGHQECCSIRKVEPLQRALKNYQAWVTGQRRDQSPTRVELAPVQLDRNQEGRVGPLVKLNPLARWSLHQTWQYIRDNQVPYNGLHDKGYVSIGCEPCTRAISPGEHERAGRWPWEEATQRECGLHLPVHREHSSRPRK